MSDRIIPVHTGCSSREDLAFYVEDFMKVNDAAASLIVERYLAHHRCQFYLRDDPDNGLDPCPNCGRLMPQPQQNLAPNPR